MDIDKMGKSPGGEEEEGKAMLERWREMRFVQFAEWDWRARKAVGTICEFNGERKCQYRYC